MRIALAQFNPTVGDLDGNVAVMGEWVRRAREASADVVLFPELAVCGYPPEDLVLRPGFVRDCRRAVDRLAEGGKGITVIGGFPQSAGNDVYNAAFVIVDGRIAATYRKIELPNYGVFDEKRYFACGSGATLLEAGDVLASVNICEDMWVEGGEAERAVIASGASVVLNLSASPFYAGKADRRRQAAAVFGMRTGAHVCCVNLVGGQDELVFDGGSMVVTPKGEVVAAAKRFEEDLLVADLSPPARPGTGGQVAGERVHVPVGDPAKREPSAARESKEMGRVEEIHAALVLGTRDYVRKNGFEKAVVGLSGGVDSSVVAALVVAALGAENVVGVTMPSKHTSRETRSDAERVAKNLGIRFLEIPLDPVYSAYGRALSELFGRSGEGVEFENLQARIRGTILMALSNRFGWLVLTTGNKSETAVGYCTLYGDTAGGFAPIKDVPKTTVYDLASHVNRLADREVIPESVIERAPTAELRPNQKDEDSLPPYALLDPVLRAYVEENRSAEEITASGFDSDMVREVVRMVDRSEYKRRQAPPGVKITPRAFGRDRRLPITNRYRG